MNSFSENNSSQFEKHDAQLDQYALNIISLEFSLYNKYSIFNVFLFHHNRALINHFTIIKALKALGCRQIRCACHSRKINIHLLLTLHLAVTYHYIEELKKKTQGCRPLCEVAQ
jgi:hypothetical protein